MRYKMGISVLGTLEGMIEKQEWKDLEVTSEEEAIARCKELRGEAEAREKVSDRFVRVQLFNSKGEEIYRG